MKAQTRLNTLAYNSVNKHKGHAVIEDILST